MIDFSSDPFDLKHISILSSELRYFTKDTESYQQEIIDKARLQSPHCNDFVQHLLSRYKNKHAIRVFFAPTMFSTIIRVCDACEDDEIRCFYLDLFRLISPSLETPIRFEFWSMRAIDECLRMHMKQEDVDEISRMTLSLKRIPIAFIVEKYLNSRPKQLVEYAINSTYIYSNYDKPADPERIIPNPEVYDKLIHALYRICNHLARVVKLGLQRVYMDLSWEAVNAQEGTSFSESFITWLKWACTRAVYLGKRERNDGYPSWCFAPFSMDVCTTQENTSQLGELYDFVCDILAEDRDKEITIKLQPYYGNEVIPDKYAFAPIFTDDPRYDPKIDEIAASYTGHTVAKIDFMHVCQRLFWDAGVGVYVNDKKESIVIPAGKGIEKYQLIRKV